MERKALKLLVNSASWWMDTWKWKRLWRPTTNSSTPAPALHICSPCPLRISNCRHLRSFYRNRKPLTALPYPFWPSLQRRLHLHLELTFKVGFAGRHFAAHPGNSFSSVHFLELLGLLKSCPPVSSCPEYTQYSAHTARSNKNTHQTKALGSGRNTVVFHISINPSKNPWGLSTDVPMPMSSSQTSSQGWWQAIPSPRIV